MNATRVAEMERITLNQVYDLSIINFLNDLAFLKDKTNEEKRIQAEWQQKRRSNSNS